MEEMNTRKRQRARDGSEPARRRTMIACNRCKVRKLKCQHDGQSGSKCAACLRSEADCHFDIPPDGHPRGAAYVAGLEQRNAVLEQQLRELRATATMSSDHLSSPHSRQDDGFSEFVGSGLQHQTATSEASPVDITIYDMLQSAPTGGTFARDGNDPTHDMTTPPPTRQAGDRLLDAAYQYTQARYCIVDWIQVKNWHMRSAELCNIDRTGSLQDRTAAYFVWMIYAIGAMFVPDGTHQAKAFFQRAMVHHDAALTWRDLTTVQGLLALAQYQVRATGGPSVWHVIGFAIRLCIELGYHQKVSEAAMRQDPIGVELRKRFFWCTFAFDSLLSQRSRRPPGIRINDIDVDFPVDVDIWSADAALVSEAQTSQLAGQEACPGKAEPKTSMTSCLHHLQGYCIRARILERTRWSRQPPMTAHEVQTFLHELEKWRSNAPTDFPATTPHQESAIIEENYFRAITDVTRPKLDRRGDAIVASVDQDMLLKCATSAARACDTSRTISLSSETQPSLMAMYEAFYHGITILQCLTLDTTILPADQIRRATTACSSTLAVYTRIYSATAPFLQLFEMLTDSVLSYLTSVSSFSVTAEDEMKLSRAKATLEEATTCDPSQIRRILRSFQRSSEDHSAPFADLPSRHSDISPPLRFEATTDGHFGEGNDFSSIYGVMDPLWLMDTNFAGNPD